MIDAILAARAETAAAEAMARAKAAAAEAAARAEAVRRYPAAEIRDREAACRTGGASSLEIVDAYRLGQHGVAVNRAKVLALSDMGCQANDNRFCGRLADAYTDSGKDQDFVKAEPYLKLACQRARPGQSEGRYCVELAIIYDTGRGGFLPDSASAKVLLRRGESLGIGNGRYDSRARFPDLDALPAMRWYVDDAGKIVRGDPPSSRFRK